MVLIYIWKSGRNYNDMSLKVKIFSEDNFGIINVTIFSLLAIQVSK